MQSMIDFMNGILWSKAVIYLLLGAGLYFSISTRFLQVRCIKEMVRLIIDGKASDKGVSSFQALAIAISARVGTGNIAGVAAAIAMGGPGAVFWMWVLGIIGASTAFVESTLAQIYKSEIDGEYRGGPAYYINKSLGYKWYAILFAFACAFSTALLLPGIQANSIGSSLESAFGISKIASGSFIVIVLAIIIFGGVKRIGKVAEIIVPIMAGLYIIVAVIIILANISALPGVFALIFKSAFGAEQVFAGILGTAISMGVKRGIYSNEAGMGTAPQAAAAAEVSHPVKQGLVQAFSIYVDTLFVCSATAFMILITGKYNVVNPQGGFLVENIPGVEMGPVYTQKAVETLFPSFGSAFVAISLFLFAFSTLLATYYFSETNLAYIFGGKTNKWAVHSLRIGFLAATFYGALRTANMAWALADVGVGIMTWLNVFAILVIGKIAFKALQDYEEQKAQGIKDPIFDPVKLGIKNADLWMTIKDENIKQKIGG